jgi:hypothetical protein
MIRSKDVLSAEHIFAICIILVLSLSIITYPLGFLARADIAPATTNTTLLNTGVDDSTSIADGTSSGQPVIDSTPDSSTDSSSSTLTSDSSSPTDSSIDSSSITSTLDSSSPPDSATDYSSEGSTTTTDSSGGSATGATGSTGNDSGTAPDLGTPTSGSSPPADSSTTTDPSSEGSTTTTDSSGASPTDGTGPTGNDSATAEVSEGSGTVGSTDVIENESSSVSETGESSPSADIAADQSSGSAMEGNTLQPPEANSLSAGDSSTESITSASAENPNAVVQPISAGVEQTVMFGDVSNSDGTSAKLFLDKQSYEPGDSAEVTVEDKDANVDPNVINTIQIIVGTSKDDPSGQILTLTETAPDSGKFTGTFSVASDNSKNHIFYDSGHPRASAVIDGVSQPGAVEVRELPVSSFQTSLGEGPPAQAKTIGNGIQVSLTDGAELAPNSVCSDNSLGSPCGGSLTVSLSYANGPPDLNGQDPASFTIYQHISIGEINTWVDLSEYTTITVNQTTKTVTASSPFGPGVFVIAATVGGGGGGGGGAGLPGSGLILDLVAPLVAANPEPPTTTSPPTSTDISLSTESTATTTDAVSQPVFSQSGITTGSANTSTTQESVKTTGEVNQNTGTATVSSSGNTTIAVPGSGDVIISFTKLGSDGTLSVSAVKTPSELSALQIAMGENGQGTLTTVDNTPYSIAGDVFMVGPLDSKFDGTATVTIPYNATLAPQASEVKIFHYTGSSWEDVTTSPPADGHVVTGSLSSLGPVVAATKSQ